MTRAETRSRRRQRRERGLKRAAARAVIITVELAAAAIQTAVFAVAIVALAYLERGYRAFGGEWLLIAIIFCAAYRMVHNRVCDLIFEEGRHR